MDHLIDPDWTFLNHGSFGSTPRELLDLQARLRAEMEAQPIRFLFRELFDRLARQQAAVADYLHADPAGLAFVTNATTGVAAVLQSLPLAAGDEILTTTHRYEAVARSMEQATGRAGARIVQAAVPFPIDDPQQVVDAVAAAMSPRTRLLVIDWITSDTALVLPVAELVALARAAGVPVLIDGAHAPGHVAVDLGRLAPDFFTGNLHKWLCTPKGCAVLWVAEGWRDRIHHPVPSHFRNQGLQAEFDWTGTFDPTAWLCAEAAVERQRRLGDEAMRSANHQLVLDARDRLCAALPWASPQAPDEMLGAMCTLPLPWPVADRQRVLDALHAARVEVPIILWSDRLWFRISAYARYNELTDYDRLAEVLQAL